MEENKEDPKVIKGSLNFEIIFDEDGPGIKFDDFTNPKNINLYRFAAMSIFAQDILNMLNSDLGKLIPKSVEEEFITTLNVLKDMLKACALKIETEQGVSSSGPGSVTLEEKEMIEKIKKALQESLGLKPDQIQAFDISELKSKMSPRKDNDDKGDKEENNGIAF